MSVVFSVAEAADGVQRAAHRKHRPLALELSLGNLAAHIHTRFGAGALIERGALRTRSRLRNWRSTRGVDCAIIERRV